MADALGAGPRMLRLLKYDIIITKNMMFFSMEQCLCPKGETEIISTELLKNLQKLH